MLGSRTLPTALPPALRKADVGRWYRTPCINGLVYPPDMVRGALVTWPCLGHKGTCTAVAAVEVADMAAGLDRMERALQGQGWTMMLGEAKMASGRQRRALVALCPRCTRDIRQHGVVAEPSPLVLTDR